MPSATKLSFRAHGRGLASHQCFSLGNSCGVCDYHVCHLEIFKRCAESTVLPGILKISSPVFLRKHKTIHGVFYICQSLNAQNSVTEANFEIKERYISVSKIRVTAPRFKYLSHILKGLDIESPVSDFYY